MTAKPVMPYFVWEGCLPDFFYLCAMQTKRQKPHRVALITLGCSKNWVDSEHLSAQLRRGDVPVRMDEGAADEADVVIINTCGFIARAKEESIDTILAFAERRKRGDLKQLYVTGCLSQRYKEELKREIPEVDAWFGTMELPAILERFSVTYKQELLGERPLMTLPHFAYLKIAEGCSRKCSFCAIPQMRGKHRSRSMEDVLAEAKQLAQRGVKELMLISQELTFYGLDRYRRRALPELLRKLVKVPGIEWIRLHYAYPGQFPYELLSVMAEEPKICPYLDIPLQHISEPVLQRMKRQTSRAEVEELVTRIREQLPQAALRTTFLLGFPGETERDVEELLEFVRRVRFERLGVFEYSHEEGTTAYALQDDVPPKEKRRRAELLMEVQRQISLEINEARVGQTLQVMIDRELDNWYVGRTSWDSPEVDNEVWIRKEGEKVNIGSLLTVSITDATEYDLYGHPAKSKVEI